jgi:hypothetical protein
MKALLICPAEREAVAALAEPMPLSNLPIFGKSLIEWWLEWLVQHGATDVTVLATDRPEQVRTLVGTGARWGLHVIVHPESRELSLEGARAKYRDGQSAEWLRVPNDVCCMDHLPGLPERPLFLGFEGWFEALRSWEPRAHAADRLGLKERQPGVWTARRARIDDSAVLQAPCWIGEGVQVGAGARIGPMAVIESRAVVEPGAEIAASMVGPGTCVGSGTTIQHSVAWGNSLIHWPSGSCIRVPDAFLLHALENRPNGNRRVGWAARGAALGLLLATLPWACWNAGRSKLKGRPALQPRRAVRPGTAGTPGVPGDTLTYYELNGAVGWRRRWPQLWNIVRGEFSWVGNRPLVPHQAARLGNDFERLWLASPLGLISLGDVEAATDGASDEARAHASFYAVQAGPRLDWSIAWRAVFMLVFGVPYSRARDHVLQQLPAANWDRQEAHG